MNNIEILEELKARLKLYKKSTDVQFTFTKSDIQAIENLIKENTELRIQISARETVVNELEKENKELKEKNKKITENCAKFIEGRDTVIQQNRKETLDYVKENYIPKSKVKEIIYPTPENPISLEIQTSEMYKKILNILEE